MNYRDSRTGFIKLVVYLIIIIVIASVIFKVDFEKLSKNEQLKKNFEFVRVKAVMLWKESLAQPFAYFWNNLALNFASKAILEKDFSNPFGDMTSPQEENSSESSEQKSTDTTTPQEKEEIRYLD